MENSQYHIEVSLAQQQLTLYREDKPVKHYLVSTARNGAGEKLDSECTPTGMHEIAEKIGKNSLPNSVFIGRKETGEIYSEEMRSQEPGRDWILSRIMWLRGLEEGVNRDGDVDSYSRYIYIHGAPDDVDFTVPGSRGCIRMTNNDVIELFDLIDEGTRVNILAK